MKKLLRISILVLLTVTFGIITSYAATHNAANCNRDTIQTLIDNASPGDIINVPAGACTWSSTLNVTKAVSIIGAGSSNSCPEAGKTCITAGMTANDTSRYTSSHYMIYVWIPTSGRAASYDKELRISGFTFDLNWQANGLYALHTGYEYTVTYPMNKFRFDNNIMKNIPGSAYSNSRRTGFMTYGEIYGVVHSNTFAGAIYFLGYGSNDNSFKVSGKGAGGRKALFWEDNAFNHNTVAYLSANEGILMPNAGSGMSVVLRYNTITYSANSSYSYLYDMFQIHGNNTPTTWAGIAYELYGNKIVDPYNKPHRTVDLRSGNDMVFYNQAVSTGAHAVNVKEYEDNCTGASADFSNPTGQTCPTASGYLYPTAQCQSENWWTALCVSQWPSGASDSNCLSCTEDGIPQHVWRTYSFNNRYGDGGAGDTLWGFTKQTGYSPERPLVENVQYFKDNALCSGSQCNFGVGCGTTLPNFLGADRCATGTGYWLTTQSCSEVPAASIGANPTTPISGTLYRCGPTNKWTAYYTPYQYPHTLRGVADTTPPILTTPCAGDLTCVKPPIEIACDDDPQDIYFGCTSTDSTDTVKYCIVGVDVGCDEDTTYDEMPNTFDGQWENYWWNATKANFACGASYTVYARAADNVTPTPNKMTTSLAIQFTIADGEDEDPPVVTNTTTQAQSCTASSLLMTISTNEASTCKWSEADEAYADMDYFFSVTGGETVHHSVNITGQACSSTVNRYVRCMDTQDNVNATSTTIPITTDAGKAISGIDLGTGSLTISIGSGTLNINIIP